MIYAVEAGTHSFTPSVALNIRYRAGVLAWRFTFDATCRYRLPGGEQADYNKLLGVSFCLTSNHRDSAMIAWRYNPDNDLIEIAPYFHVSGRRIIGAGNSGQPFSEVAPGQDGEANMVIDWRNNSVLAGVIVGGTYASYRQQFDRLSRNFFGFRTYWTREIGAWFGGNLPAPHNMNLEKETI